MASRKKSAEQSLPTDATEESGSHATEMSFEDAMSQLASIVEELESGELSLEESLKQFEAGIQLARRSQSRLDAAEARVEELLGFDEDGVALTEEI